MGYLPPGDLDLVSKYLGLPQGYAPAGIPPAAPTVTMPTVEMGPAMPAPMPVVVPPTGATAPMPVVNPDADALARQLGLAPATRMPVAAPSSPIAPQSVGLQLPPGIAPPGTAPVPSMANPPPPPPSPAAPQVPPPSAPVAGPPAPPPVQAHQAAPPRPAGPREPSWTDKRRADEAAYLATFGAERTAAREANDAGAVVRDENAQATARLARLQEEQAANEASFARDEAEARAAYRAQTQRQVDEVREMKVDPGRLYRDSGAWTGIMVAIGGGLAGALSGFQGRGGENAFVDIINKNIDRDINAQVQAISQKNASIADRNSLYGQLVASHKDDVLARAQTRATMLESARTHMEAEAQRLGTVEAQKRFEVLDAQMARTQEQANAAVHGAEEQAAARLAAAQAAARAAAAAHAEAMRDKRLKQGLELEKARLERDKYELDREDKLGGGGKLAERFVQTDTDPTTKMPTGYLARNPKVAEEQAEGIAAAKEAIEAARRILGRRNKEGAAGRATGREAALALINPLAPSNTLGTPTWKVANDVDQAILLAKANKAMKLGTLDAGSKPIIEAAAGKNPNALDLVGDDTNDRLREFVDINERFLEIQKQAQGAGQVRKDVAPNGAETYTRLGKVNTISNPRTEPRFDANRKPIK